MAHFSYKNQSLGITAVNGSMFIDCGNFKIQEIKELPLSELMEVYGKWQHLSVLFQTDLASEYLNNKNARDLINEVLEKFGLDYSLLTLNQIEALLFYVIDKGEDGRDKISHSLLWQFHNVFPRTLDLPDNPEEPSIDFDKYCPDLDLFETAILYLSQTDKEDLIYKWPISRIYKILLSKSFIDWAANPKNKEMLKQKQDREFVENNPIDTDALQKQIQEQMNKKKLKPKPKRPLP